MPAAISKVHQAQAAHIAQHLLEEGREAASRSAWRMQLRSEATTALAHEEECTRAEARRALDRHLQTAPESRQEALLEIVALFRLSQHL